MDTQAGIPLIGDAFGAALMDSFERSPHGMRLHVIERDDGFIDTADTAQYFAPPEAWSALDRWAIEGIAGRVLDIGAGAGRHALFLQERGCAVVALDVSPLAVGVCAKRGVRETFAGTIEQYAATDPAPFDGFVLLGNNLGLLRNEDYAPRFVALLAAMARPGATIAGTCLDPYRSGDPAHLAYHERNRAAGRMAGQVRMRIRYRRLATNWWDYLFLSLEELRALTASTRWRMNDVREDGVLYAVRLTLK